MKLIDRTRKEWACVNHGKAADWGRFFDEHEVCSMLDIVRTVIPQPQHYDDQTGPRVDGEQ